MMTKEEERQLKALAKIGIGWREANDWSNMFHGGRKLKDGVTPLESVGLTEKYVGWRGGDTPIIESREEYTLAQVLKQYLWAIELKDIKTLRDLQHIDDLEDRLWRIQCIYQKYSYPYPDAPELCNVDPLDYDVTDETAEHALERINAHEAETDKTE